MGRSRGPGWWAALVLLVGVAFTGVRGWWQTPRPLRALAPVAAPVGAQVLTEARQDGDLAVAAPTVGGATAGPTAPAPPPPPLPPPVRITVAAVGDLLMHLPLVQSSRLPDGSGYDFTPIFAATAPLLRSADLAIANLETTLAGSDWPLSGYPSFNTPPELARDVRQIGIDVLTNANNHSMDYGRQGLLNTLDHLDRYGVIHTGAFRTPAERDRPVLVERQGVKIGLLAYTYGTNGIPVPEPHLVNPLDPDLIKRDIAATRAAGADLISVSLHFGEEYQRHPNDSQQALVQELVAAGADLILGSHPHVLQPIEWVTAGHRRGLVIYSMGNFVSNQVGLQRNTGVIFLVTVEKPPGAAAHAVAARYVLTYTQQRRVAGVIHTRVLPVEQALSDYRTGSDPLLTAEDYERLQRTWTDHLQHLPGSPEVSVFSLLPPPAAAGRVTGPVLFDH